MDTIIVTGGSGFIGSHLIDRLIKAGMYVINIDNFDPFYSRAIKENNIKNHIYCSNYQLLEIDIRDYEKLKKLVNFHANVIVHLAAKAGVRQSVRNPRRYQEVNIIGTQNMLEIARTSGVKQFIYASSSSVYGDNINVPWSEKDYSLKPISPYACSKISGEMLGYVYSLIYDIRFISLRFFSVYGPRQRPDLAIHKFIRLATMGKNITLYGDGNTTRDYTYIDDIIDGIMAAIKYCNTQFEVINIGNGKTIRLIELVDSIEKILGMPIKIKYGPRHTCDVKQTYADITKAKKILGYEPDFDIQRGLTEFVKWYKK